MTESLASLPFVAEEVDPKTFFAGTVLLTAPHQDDCVLACGATLAHLGGGERIHVAYGTDGADSPEPLLPWRDRRPGDLDVIRAEEARRALQTLNVSPANVHFMGFPDRCLKDYRAELRRKLDGLRERIRPDHVLTPFRFDRHPDHLALHRGVVDCFGGRDSHSEVSEYFVYHQSRLLGRGDVRAYVRPGLLWAVPAEPVAAAKRRALDCFESQTTRMYSWQTRPNLSAELLNEVSSRPEIFLRYDPEMPGAEVLEGPRFWILAAHRLEPVLKRRKDQLVAIGRRALGGGDSPKAQP